MCINPFQKMMDDHRMTRREMANALGISSALFDLHVSGRADRVMGRVQAAVEETFPNADSREVCEQYDAWWGEQKALLRRRLKADHDTSTP